MLKCSNFGNSIFVFDFPTISYDQAREFLNRIYPGDDFLDKDEHPDEDIFHDFGDGKSGLVDVASTSLDISSPDDYEEDSKSG